MRLLTSAELIQTVLSEIGLDPAAHELSSAESIACMLRRAAGLLCPAPPRTLVNAVTRPLHGLVPDLQDFQVLVREILEDELAVGDLAERRQDSGGASLICCAAPSYVVRTRASTILLGVGRDRETPIPHDLLSEVEFRRHLRLLDARVDPSRLDALGFIRLSNSAWLNAPLPREADDHVRSYARLLPPVSETSRIRGLTIIDPARRSDYYPGRWVRPKAQTGSFVGRREQAFGSDLWCYVHLVGGSPRRFVDFPTQGFQHRGCDEAWHLQAAIDATKGNSQRIAVRVNGGATGFVDVFSPIPQWLTRRWTSVGEQVAGGRGALTSFQFPLDEVEEEARFASRMLWMTVHREPGS